MELINCMENDPTDPKLNVGMDKVTFGKIAQEFADYAYDVLERARKEGLTWTSIYCRKDGIEQRDPFHLGICLVCDGYDYNLIASILNNIIDQYKRDTPPDNFSPYTELFLKMKRIAIMNLQWGTNPSVLHLIFDSMIPLDLQNDKFKAKTYAIYEHMICDYPQNHTGVTEGDFKSGPDDNSFR